jgi:NTP pyrophosphatase (non-canonical NTP hydrolase)
MNTVLGLGGEAGEVIDVLSQISDALAIKSGKVLDDVKKYSFHNWSEMYQAEEGAFELLREKLGKELGDLQWYIAVLADLFNYTLGEIAKINRQKLIERHGTAVDSSPIMEVGARYKGEDSYRTLLTATAKKFR